MSNKFNDIGAAEIIGAVLMLALVVSAFSTVYLSVLSEPGPPEETNVTIIGLLENDKVFFEHQRGESIHLNSEVILTIAGVNHKTTVDYLLDQSSKDDGSWDIGEQLVYSDIPVSGLRVEATIIDASSRSIVMWGLLQEGYVEPPFGRGGMWHFDEASWSGTSYDVIDSSGNNNNGISRNGANIDTLDSKSGNSGLFDGLDDYVEVESTYSLDIRDEITVEAWMKPLIFNSQIETQKYNSYDHGFEPDIIHINDDYYAIVSRSQGHSGLLGTIKISEDGSISDDLIAELEFESDSCYEPDIHHVNGNIYAIAHRYGSSEANSKGRLKTVEITDEGIITDNIIHEIEFIGTKCLDPRIISVSDTIIAIAYTGLNDNGFLKTFEIDTAGQITDLGFSLTFDNSIGITPEIIKVTDDIYAVAYTGPDDDGFVTTVEINPLTGEIIDPGYKLEIDDKNLINPDITHVSGEIYAIAYRGEDNDGFVKTIKIDSNGEITDTDCDIFEFEKGDCDEPDIIFVSDNTYAIMYNHGSGGGNRQGKCVTVEILPDGDITDYSETVTSNIGQKCFGPRILYIAPRVYAVVYSDMSSHPMHITTLIAGEDPTPIWMRGICRIGAINIYADESNVYASAKIGGTLRELTLSITPSNWYHVAVSYDGSRLSLYCNRDTDTFTINNGITYAYQDCSGEIESVQNNLLFGYHFNGFIDEIAIFDHVLTETEINNHFTNPGLYN